MYTDQTGKFPHSSSLGSNYQMILHEIDGASTWVEVMNNKMERKTIKARRHGLIIMKQQGITPAHQVLNNEISQTYKDNIRESGISYQLVPPDDHHHNIAEKAIQTRKNHFVGILSGLAALFPHTPMVPIHPTGRTPTYVPLNVKCQPKNLLLRPHIWST